MLYMKEVLNTYMAAFCGQSIDKVRLDTDRDYYMSPEDAVSYGLIDEVIHHKNMLELKPKEPTLMVLHLLIF